MEYRQLGRSGLKVSVLTMGTMTIGGKGNFAKVGNVGLAEAQRLIDLCIDQGVNLIDMPADITIAENEITVRFHRRAHLPIVLASGLFDKPVVVPWWNGRSLRLLQ